MLRFDAPPGHESSGCNSSGQVESQAVEAKQEHHGVAGGVVRGLEELEVLFSDVKSRFARYILFCVIVSLTWPLLFAVLIIQGGYPSIPVSSGRGSVSQYPSKF